MRIFTFTPFDFDLLLFSRDTGLVTRGLQAIGIESKVVLLGKQRTDEHTDIMRITWHQACDPAWWRQWRLDGVVSFSWAQPKYAPCLKAISGAGIRIFIKLDCGEPLLTPRIATGAYMRHAYRCFRDDGRSVVLAVLQMLVKTVLHCIPACYLNPLMNYFALADAVGVESPLGVELLQKTMALAGRQDLIPRVRLVGQPIAPYMRFSGGTKIKQIIAVGRWESYVKNAPLLVRTLALVLRAQPDYTAVICGSGIEQLRALVDAWASDLGGRIQLLGPMGNDALPRHLIQSQILIVSSFFEGFSIAAAEALCCGCSVVIPQRIGSMRWCTAEQCGSLAAPYDAGGMSEAVFKEIRAWDEGRRDPVRISELWYGRIAAPNVARQILHALRSDAA